ncbi:MAG TPA: hypothetical protein VHT30_09465 [Acidimicrobiales bacterium]|jgi:hypothetical protein|nr:hypothetical protein [Acidimicrobiales bacterium]
MAVALLRVADQRRERTPSLCVKSGEPTQDAVRVTAVAVDHADRWQLWLGPLAVVWARVRSQPRFQVILPVSRRSWRRVTRGRAVAALLGTLGAAAMIGAIPNGGFASLATTWLLLLPAWLVRAWFHWRRWVGLEFRPSQQDIRVTRVHSRFADAARQLWLRSLPHT